MIPITTIPTPDCACSALHTSKDCEKHWPILKRCLLRDRIWRVVESFTQWEMNIWRQLGDEMWWRRSNGARTITAGKVADRYNWGLPNIHWITRPKSCLSLAHRSPATLRLPDDEGEDMPKAFREAIEAAGREIFPGAGFDIPGANIVKPKNADAPMISFVRPFGGNSADTQALIKTFKAVHPEIKVKTPDEPMRGRNIGLKPIGPDININELMEGLE